MKSNPHSIPDQVGLTTRLFYGVGSVAEGTKNTAFNVFLLFYYNAVLGLSGTLTGAAIFVALCVDAFTDPLMGSISDNTHSRWGRRHPFMYASALPMAICFYLVFNPPALEPTGLFVWLCVFAIGVRVSIDAPVKPPSAAPHGARGKLEWSHPPYATSSRSYGMPNGHRRGISTLAFVLVPAGFAAAPSNASDMLVTGWTTSNVVAYDPITGAFDRVIAGSGADGLTSAHSIAVGPDADLYVSSTGNAKIHRYDGGSGDFVEVFADPGAVGGASPADAIFGPAGNLYVSSIANGGIFRFDGTSGAFIDTLVAPGSNSMTSAEMLAWGPDGLLYVCSANTNGVKRYDINGTFMGNAVTTGSGGLNDPHHLLFKPDGNLLVGSFAGGNVLEYDVVARTFVGEFVSAGAGGLGGPHGLAWGPDGHLYVADFFTNRVLKYSMVDGSPLGVFANTAPTLLAPSHLAFRSGVTAIPEMLAAAAERLGVRSVHPNPALDSQTVEYHLGKSAAGSLRIFDAAGRLVQRFEVGGNARGSITWNGRDGSGRRVPAGVYFVRLETAGGAAGRKLVRVR